jgi:hypothetical protein
MSKPFSKLFVFFFCHFRFHCQSNPNLSVSNDSPNTMVNLTRMHAKNIFVLGPKIEHVLGEDKLPFGMDVSSKEMNIYLINWRNTKALIGTQCIWIIIIKSICTLFQITYHHEIKWCSSSYNHSCWHGEGLEIFIVIKKNAHHKSIV